MDDPQDPGREYVAKSSVMEDARKVYSDVVDGFMARRDRDDATSHYWDLYNCRLSDRQSYSGGSEIYVPVVRDAIEARTLRFTNALFPQNGRYAECISQTADHARALTALVNHYVRESRLRETVGSMMRSGDVSGQYSLYTGWQEKKRTFMQRREVPVTVDGMDMGETVETVEEVSIESGSPDIWVIPDQDLCVLPATVDDIDDADTVAVAMRVTKSWVRAHKDRFSVQKYKQALALFDASRDDPSRANPGKDRSKEAGLKADKGSKFLLLYEIWTSLKLDGERTPAVIIAAGEQDILSIRKNPFWGQRPPVISAPVKKIAGSFWGISPCASVEKLQYQCNDAINMGMDAAKYALMPIVMTDPLANPRVGTMVLEMAAVWETSPNATEIVKFPPLWQDGLQIVAATKAQIHESLGLNPAMMPSGAGARKPSQAQVAQEQAVALEATSDAVRIMESFILTPLVQRIFEYDQQYRNDDLLIAHFGELGYEAMQERIPPVQMGTRYSFVWNGTASGQNAQRVQQMIAAMNVLRGMPPNALGGRQLDVGPILDTLVDVTFGPRLGSRVLKDVRQTLSIDPRIENEMLMANMPATVSPLDDDAAHIQAHHAAALMLGDPQHMFAAHIQKHQLQMQAKVAQMQPQQGAQGVPGGAGPGVPGTPRMGAQPQGPRGAAQQPPGAVHPDQMRDAAAMPRKM